MAVASAKESEGEHDPDHPDLVSTVDRPERDTLVAHHSHPNRKDVSPSAWPMFPTVLAYVGGGKDAHRPHDTMTVPRRSQSLACNNGARLLRYSVGSDFRAFSSHD